MASIFDKLKHSVKNGELHKRWKEAKEKKDLKLPKKDFGTELDNFETSVQTANSILEQINRLIGELKEEKEKCVKYSKAALNTAEFYKSEVPKEETTVVNELDRIIEDIGKYTENVSNLPTTLQ